MILTSRLKVAGCFSGAALSVRILLRLSSVYCSVNGRHRKRKRRRRRRRRRRRIQTEFVVIKKVCQSMSPAEELQKCACVPGSRQSRVPNSAWQCPKSRSRNSGSSTSTARQMCNGGQSTLAAVSVLTAAAAGSGTVAGSQAASVSTVARVREERERESNKYNVSAVQCNFQ